MARKNRLIIAGQPYEIIPRARDTLPLPPSRLTNTFRLGIFARAQRDDKVTLCNLACMNNHDHMQVIPKEPKEFTKFYCEVLKKTTDSLRAIVGEKSLRIWEDRASVTLLGELEDAIKQTIYLFCNPAKADLCDTIDSYEGISSWKAFTTCEPSVDAKFEIPTAWHPVRTLPKIGRRGLTKEEDALYAGRLCASKSSVKHTLVFEPFAWLKPYGVTDPEDIEAIRQRVIKEVREREAKYLEKRRKKGRPSIKPQKLKSAPYLAPHTPKKKERKIFVLCENRRERIAWIELFNEIEARCRECYELAKAGKPAEWPPGTFIPWLPPRECYQCD